MTQVKIDLKKAIDAQYAVNAVLSIKLKLEKIVAALQHTNATPDFKYLINYMVGPVGNSIVVSSHDISTEGMDIGSRLKAAGVMELAEDGSYAELTDGVLDYLIEEKMRDGKLIVNGSKIRYKVKPSRTSHNPWLTLPDSVQIIVTRLELTDEDHKEFRQRQLKEAFDAVTKLGYTIDEEGVLTVV